MMRFVIISKDRDILLKQEKIIPEEIEKKYSGCCGQR